MKCVRNCRFLNLIGPNSYYCWLYNEKINTVNYSEETHTIRCKECEQEEIIVMDSKIKKLEALSRHMNLVIDDLKMSMEIIHEF